MTIRDLLFALPLVLVGWIAVLAIVSVQSDAAPGSVVVLPSAHFLQNLPESSTVLAANRWSITLQSKEPGHTRALYDSGAWLVLPAGLPGCLPLPKPVQARAD